MENVQAAFRALRRDPGAGDALSARRSALGRADRLGPGAGEKLAARLFRHAGAERRPCRRARLAVGARHGRALGRRGRQARPGAGHRPRGSRLPANRPADRLAPGTLHRGGAQRSGRSGRAAPELARCLRLCHQQGRARPRRLRPARRPLRPDRQDPGRGRRVERHPRLRRQLPRRLGRAALRRRRADRDRALDRHPDDRGRDADRRRPG
jgi:hypothetical protein